MVEVDDLLEIQGQTGKVCFKKEEDGNTYICVGFFAVSEGQNNFVFKYYEVQEQDGKIMTKEIENKDLLLKLSTDFLVNTVERTGTEEDFLKVFDN